MEETRRKHWRGVDPKVCVGYVGHVNCGACCEISGHGHGFGYMNVRIYWLDGIRGTEARGLISKVCVKGVWNVNHQTCCEVFGRRMGSYHDVTEGGHLMKKKSESVGFLMACQTFECEVRMELWRRLYFLCQKFTTLEGLGFFYLARSNNRPVVMGPFSIHLWKNEFFYVKNSSFENSGILVH